MIDYILIRIGWYQYRAREGYPITLRREFIKTGYTQEDWDRMFA